jgi:hypothetical protein
MENSGQFTEKKLSEVVSNDIHNFHIRFLLEHFSILQNLFSSTNDIELKKITHDHISNSSIFIIHLFMKKFILSN